MQIQSRESKHPHIEQLIQHLISLESVLNDNSYISTTRKKLAEILSDAQANIQFLFAGKNLVGKSSVINALIGRELLPLSTDMKSDVNIFLKHSDKEHIEVFFIDGYTAIFTLDKLSFFTNYDNEIAKTIREHIDYIVINSKQTLLENITFIEAKSVEQVKGKRAFISPFILARADDIFWVISSDQPASEEEIALFSKLSSENIKINILINISSELTKPVHQFIQQEKARYSEFAKAFYYVSAEKALQARKTNNTQKLIDSNITNFVELLLEHSNNKELKNENTLKNLSNWFEILNLEFQLISSKEPYTSALQNILKYKEDIELEHSRQHRDLAIIKTYESDYKDTANIFGGVQTLYQLVQVLGTNFYLRDEVTETFETIATNYHHTIRTYRSLLSEYNTTFDAIKKYVKKKVQTEAEVQVAISSRANLEDITEKITELNDKRELLNTLLNSIKKIEQSLLEQLQTIQPYLMNLTNNRLAEILLQVSELNRQRQSDYHATASYVNKLKEFDCLVEAKQLLQQSIKPILIQLAETSAYDHVQSIISKIDEIIKMEFPHQGLLKEVILDDALAEQIHVNFEETYPMTGLNLSENDVKSNIPSMPLKINVN